MIHIIIFIPIYAYNEANKSQAREMKVVFVKAEADNKQQTMHANRISSKVSAIISIISMCSRLINIICSIISLISIIACIELECERCHLLSAYV